MKEAMVPINKYLLSTFLCHKQHRPNLCLPFQCSRKPFIAQNRIEAQENQGFGNYKSDLNIFNILKLTTYNYINNLRSVKAQQYHLGIKMVTSKSTARQYILRICALSHK